MGKRERYEPGTFCWVDLATTDPAGAKAFYTELFGWEAEDMPAGEAGTYTMLRLAGDDVGGLYEMEAERREQGIPPHWFSYVSVESADDAAARAGELGGTAHGDAFDVGEDGRIAVISDPTGAVLGAWEPRTHIGAHRVNDVGCMGWNELQTRDSETASAFYGGLFGWETEPIERDGELVYTTIKNAGSQNGGFMPMTEQHGDAPPFWLPYFTVASCDDAVAKVRELGGEALAGPMDLPDPPPSRIAVVSDPQGAAFAIFEGETDD
jgi:predicted enzyme related to lactoylglutathione lyase